jgi:hypothetical protein
MLVPPIEERMRAALLCTVVLLAACDNTNPFPPTVNATRGSYLVNTVLDCGGCHTRPPAPGQPFDPTTILSGGFEFDITIGGMPQKIYSANLTSDPTTGIGKWTDDQIKTALRKGIDNEGKPLFPIMPFWAFSNMSDNDLQSIVLYLRTVPPKVNQVPDDTYTIPSQVSVLDPSKIPQSTLPSSDARYASAQNGRYIAGLMGACIHCHSPSNPAIDPPIDLSRAFSGGQLFPLGFETTVSANITPDVTGLAGWTVEDIVTTLQTDQEKGTGRKLCLPMPGGAQGVGAMTISDLTDVANYLTTLAPIDHGPFGCTDAGVPYGLDGAN